MQVRSGLLRAVLSAPLAAPAAYACLLLGQTAFRGISGEYRQNVWGASADAGLVIFSVGTAIAYCAMIFAGLPGVLLLRRAGMLRLGPVVALGASVGLIVAHLLEPYVRGDLFSIPFTWWQGGIIGVVTALVFWRALVSSAPAGASGEEASGQGAVDQAQAE